MKRPDSEWRRRMAANYTSHYYQFKAWLASKTEAVIAAKVVSFEANCGGNLPGDPTERAVEKLERIGMDERTRIVRVIDQEWKLFEGFIDFRMDGYTEQEKDKVKDAIWKNLTEGRRYESMNRHFEMPISRVTFFRYRREILENIANNIGI